MIIVPDKKKQKNSKGSKLAPKAHNSRTFKAFFTRQRKGTREVALAVNK